MFLPYSVIGHTRQLSVLEQDILSGAVSHAYLFSGPARVGKRTVALQFAQRLLCADRRCGTCTVCRHISAGTYPDVHVVTADEDGSITIEQTRAMLEWMRLTRTGAYKVCIIEDADRMSLPAMQAMLKSLEEPPPGTVCILTTSSLARIPLTIVSRVRSIPFRLVPDDELQTGCATIGIRFESWEIVAPLIEGRPGRAVQLFEDPSHLNRRIQQMQMARDVLDTYDIVARFQFADEIAKEKNASVDFLSVLLTIVRERVKTAHGPERTKYARLAHLIEETHQLLPTSVNAKLNLEHLMLHV